MRKKLYLGLITAVVISAATACGEEGAETSEAVETSMEETVEDVSEETTVKDVSADASSLKELRKNIGIEAETTISNIEKSYEEMTGKLGDSYSSYMDNRSVLTDWYSSMLSSVEETFNSIKTMSVDYYNHVPTMVDTSDRDAVEEAMDDFKDDIYDDVMDEFKDRIYDGIIEDLKDDYYDGVIEDCKETVDYGDWLDVRSEFYDEWLDVRSDFYDLWLDVRSDIYSDWLDVRGEFWSGNFDVDDILGAGFMGEVKEAMGEETTEEVTEPETTTAAETTEAETTAAETVPETEAIEQNITAENNSDFKALIEDKEPSGDMQKAFVDKYEGQTIEFDGNIAFINNHGDYSTRYDVLVYAGDYSEVSVSGPAFQFNDVGVTELTGELFLPDYVKMGSNVHIVATVHDYNEGSGLLLLKPKSIEQR